MGGNRLIGLLCWSVPAPFSEQTSPAALGKNIGIAEAVAG